MLTRFFARVILLSSMLAGCAGAGGVLAGKADWSTLMRGNGAVDTRVVNESGETITVRFQDEGDKIVAQAPLPPHEAETLSLPKGPLRATVRVERDGHAQYSDEQKFEAKPSAKPAVWKFSPPSVE